MEGPAPLNPINEETEKYDKIKEKKEYSIQINNISYKFIIYIDHIHIYFLIKEINNIVFYIYENKYDIDQIIKILKLNVNFYDNLHKIINLLDQVYLRNKIKLEYIINKDTFKINIKLPIDYQEYDSYLILDKKELDNNDKFDIIIKELCSLQKDKIKDNKINILKKYIFDLKILIIDKLNENVNQIYSLKNELLKNEKLLKENKKEINILKNKILDLKESIDKINNNNIKNNEKNDKNNKKDLKNKSIKKNIKNSGIIQNKIEPIKLLQFKIMLIGGVCAGKTSIIEKYLSKPFSNLAQCTINIYITDILLEDIKIKLIISDSPGQVTYKDLILDACQKQDLIVFIYKITNRKIAGDGSFIYVEQLIKEVKRLCKKNIHYVLVGSSADLEEERQISFKEGEELAQKENLDFFMEVSAYSGYNINNLFNQIAKILYKNHQ